VPSVGYPQLTSGMKTLKLNFSSLVYASRVKTSCSNLEPLHPSPLRTQGTPKPYEMPTLTPLGDVSPMSARKETT
jgi:hypothetical protein